MVIIWWGWVSVGVGVAALCAVREKSCACGWLRGRACSGYKSCAFARRVARVVRLWCSNHHI